MKMKPLFDRVVLKQTEAKEKTEGGIILPSAAQEKPQTGIVIAVGAGGIGADGKEIIMQVKEGDKVLYPKYSGSEYKIDGEVCTILRQTDILAIIEN